MYFLYRYFLHTECCVLGSPWTRNPTVPALLQREQGSSPAH